MTRRVEQGGFTSGRRRTPKDPIDIGTSMAGLYTGMTPESQR